MADALHWTLKVVVATSAPSLAVSSQCRLGVASRLLWAYCVMRLLRMTVTRLSVQYVQRLGEGFGGLMTRKRETRPLL